MISRLALVLARRIFGQISRGEWDAVLARAAPDVHHVFPGDHALGGERHDRDAVRRWFERLGRLFPGHDFEVRRAAISGVPWDLWMAVQWTATLRPATGGESYENDGAHWIRVRRGAVTDLHAYLDTQRVAAACDAMAAAGVGEAAAAPILS